MAGWIKLHRAIMDNQLWHKEPFTWGQAWIDLLMLANSQPGHIFRRGIKVEIDRGEVGVSIRGLATRWHWSIGKVQRFLGFLNEEKMVTKTGTKNTSVNCCIKITNYDAYQKNDTKNDTPTGTKTGTKTGTEQEVKNKRIKNTPPEDDKFSLFWQAYPKRIAKKDALKAWNKLNCGNGSLSIIMEKLEQFKQSDAWARDNGRFIPNPATWLNGERWNDEVECQLPPQGQKIGGVTF